MNKVTVDWGDGQSEQFDVGDTEDWSITGKQHTYATDGSYSITVSGVAGGQATQSVTVAAPAPTVTALEPATAAINSPEFDGHIRGTGFTEDTVIVWNGKDEPTRFVSATDVWTKVEPSVVTSPTTLDVTVRSGRGPNGRTPVTPPKQFVWTAAAPVAPAGNATLKAWQDWARLVGASDEDIEGKTRDQLRDTYANATPPAE